MVLNKGGVLREEQPILGTLAEPCSQGCLRCLPRPPLRCRLFLSTAPLTDHCIHVYVKLPFSVWNFSWISPGSDLPVVAPVHIFKIVDRVSHCPSRHLAQTIVNYRDMSTTHISTISFQISQIKMIHYNDKGAFSPKGPLKCEFYFHILDCRSRKPTTTMRTLFKGEGGTHIQTFVL